MRILLLGEYSNVHATLARGLRTLGHEVTVASNGDFWKNYPRDIDLSRLEGRMGGGRLLAKVLWQLRHFRGYDIVQLINPMFLELRAEHILPVYRYLRRHNQHVVLGAFGMDYYWVNVCSTTMPLRYSDFNIGKTLRTGPDAVKERKDWIGTAKEKLNRFIANDCDAIVAGLYEYWVCYHPLFPMKTHFIPYPIVTEKSASSDEKGKKVPSKVNIFIGISRKRSEYKGTDIMLRAAQAVLAAHPDRMQLQVAEGVPFNEYVKMMKGADAILDQLYSYTPSMNPLEAMAHGIVCIGGGEPENYAILHEDELRPIINVKPTYESVYKAVEDLVLHPERLPELQRQSIVYIERHHDHLKVARQYEELYLSLMA